MSNEREPQKQVTKRRVAVLNRDDREYSEEWQGTNIVIPGGKAVEMSFRDANSFLGTYGGQDPRDPSKPKTKNLAIRELDEVPGLVVNKIGARLPDPVQTFICNYDGKSFPTQAELDKHLATLSDKMMKEETPQLQDPTGEVTCQFCGKTGIKGSHGLMSHIRQCPAVKAPAPEPEEQTVAAEEPA